MELEETVKKEIRKMEKVFKKIKLLDGNVKEIFNLAKAYLDDSKYFYKKKDFLRAFEAAVISWAYVDGGLHMKILDVPEEEKEVFTV